LSGDLGIRISCGNNSIKEKSFLQAGTLRELPKKGKDIEGDKDDVNDRKIF
jgi:hypothetical protein